MLGRKWHGCVKVAELGWTSGLNDANKRQNGSMFAHVAVAAKRRIATVCVAA